MLAIQELLTLLIQVGDSAVLSDNDDFAADGAWIGWTTNSDTNEWHGHELEGDDPASA